MTKTSGIATAACAIAAAAIGFAGCGGDDTSAAEGETPSTAVTTESTAPVETTPAETTQPVETAPSTTAPATASPTAITIVVANAAPQGGIKRATVEKGDRVTLVVRSDVADEIHLHGYDKMTEVSAGGVARLSFVASVPGRFEVELEDHGVQIADLTVEP